MPCILHHSTYKVDCSFLFVLFLWHSIFHRLIVSLWVTEDVIQFHPRVLPFLLPISILFSTLSHLWGDCCLFCLFQWHEFFKKLSLTLFLFLLLLFPVQPQVACCLPMAGGVGSIPHHAMLPWYYFLMHFPWRRWNPPVVSIFSLQHFSIGGGAQCRSIIFKLWQIHSNLWEPQLWQMAAASFLQVNCCFSCFFHHCTGRLIVIFSALPLKNWPTVLCFLLPRALLLETSIAMAHTRRHWTNGATHFSQVNCHFSSFGSLLHRAFSGCQDNHRFCFWKPCILTLIVYFFIGSDVDTPRYLEIGLSQTWHQWPTMTYCNLLHRPCRIPGWPTLELGR